MEEMFGWVQQGFAVLNPASLPVIPLTQRNPFVPYKTNFSNVPYLSVILHDGKKLMVWPSDDDIFTAIDIETNECWKFEDIEVEVVGRYYPTSIEYKGLESTDREDITLVGNNKVWE